MCVCVCLYVADRSTLCDGDIMSCDITAAGRYRHTGVSLPEGNIQRVKPEMDRSQESPDLFSFMIVVCVEVQLRVYLQFAADAVLVVQTHVQKIGQFAAVLYHVYCGSGGTLSSLKNIASSALILILNYEISLRTHYSAVQGQSQETHL